MSRIVTLDTLVGRLLEVPEDDVTVERVGERLADGTLDEESVRRYVRYRDDKYARHLVHRSELFDVMVLCWRPGQRTPIHNHSGQLGWVRLVRGNIEETSYRLEGGGSVPIRAKLELDRTGIGHDVDLQPTGHALASEPGTVVTVDRVRAIHRLGNPSDRPGDDPAVTLHVYSRPHDWCLTFEPDERTCRRRDLAFDNVGGDGGGVARPLAGSRVA